MPKVIGLRRVDYVNDQGRQVKGFTFYLSEPRDGVAGACTYDVYFNGSKADNFVGTLKTLDDAVGMEINISYNRFGKPEDIMLMA